jgi:integrase
VGVTPTETDEIEALKSKIERLQAQLLEQAKPRDAVFLAETIPANLPTKGKLTALTVKGPGRAMLGDGGGLWLQRKRGGRSWLFRYTLGDRAKEMGLGSLSDVTLAQARARAWVCRNLVKVGIDPIERQRSLAVVKAPMQPTTFRQAAERYYEAKKAGWRSEKHAIQFPNTMRDYVYPIIGDMPVADVDTDRVLSVLNPIWTKKPETASRVRARIEQVLDWAAARKMRSGENPARWRGHLSALLPERRKLRRVENHPALPFSRMFDFWQALAARESVSAEALRFTILTAARTGEVIGARWGEIDLEARMWVVPAHRMKAHREHRVALSDEALAVLERLRLLKAGDDSFVFPGTGVGKPLSNMAMTMLLRKLGRQDITVHGFRSSFSDWAAESTNYPRDMVEMALAHTVSNKVEAAYRRGDMVERRRLLMRDWAMHCTTPPAEADNLRRIGEAR